MPPMPPPAPAKAPPPQGGGRPMPMRPGMGQPPAAPPPGAAGGGGPEEDIKRQVEATVAQFPPGRFSVVALNKLADTIKAVIPAILGKNAPKGEFNLPPFEGKMVEGPLPQPLAVASVLLLYVAANADPTYTFDVTGIDADDGVMEIIAKLKKAAKDPDVKKAAEGSGDMDAKEEGDEPPEDTSEEEMGPPPGAAKYM